jgi:hypothetical protein
MKKRGMTSKTRRRRRSGSKSSACSRRWQMNFYPGRLRGYLQWIPGQRVKSI